MNMYWHDFGLKFCTDSSLKFTNLLRDLVLLVGRYITVMLRCSSQIILRIAAPLWPCSRNRYRTYSKQKLRELVSMLIVIN
jgi:hypothetical protein